MHDATPNSAMPEHMSQVVTEHLVCTTGHLDSVADALRQMTAAPRREREARAAERQRNRSAWSPSGPVPRNRR